MGSEIESDSGYKYGRAEVINEKGIHARPSALICIRASKYKGDIYLNCLMNPESNDREINPNERYNAKSIMSIMSIYAPQGSILKVNVEGTDKKAVDTCRELCDLIASELDDIIPQLEKEISASKKDRSMR